MANETIKINGTDQPSKMYMKDGNWGAYFLSTQPELYEPQRSNTFLLEVNFPDGFFKNDTILQKQNPHAYANPKEVLRVAVNSSFVPHFTVDPITVKRGNSSIKFAGTPTYKDGDIKLTDFIGAGSKDLAMAWQRKVYNSQTEKVGLASDYKVNAKLLEYTPDYQVVRTWTLFGAWITGLSEDDYSHESADKRDINCSVVYDKAEIDVSSLG